MAPNKTTSMDLPPVLSQLLGPMAPPVTQTPSMGSPAMQPPVNQAAFNPAASGMSSGLTQDNAAMPGYAMGGMVDSGGMASAMTQQQPQTFMPSYAVGGMVGADGMPEGGLGAPGMPPGGMPQMSGAGGVGAAGVQSQMPQTLPSPQQIEMAVQDFINNNPQQVAQIQQVIVAGMQDGTLSMQDMNMMEQMAMTAMQNPEMYPNIRQLAIQQGFAGEQDLPQQYEPAVIFSVLVAARIAKQVENAPMGGAPMGGAPMGGAPAGGMQAPNFAMGGMVNDMTVRPGEMAADGGKVEGPGTGTSDSVPIRVSTGEYVIPANVVRMKGKEFFDSMLEKYKDSE